MQFQMMTSSGSAFAHLNVAHSQIGQGGSNRSRRRRGQATVEGGESFNPFLISSETELSGIEWLGNQSWLLADEPPAGQYLYVQPLGQPKAPTRQNNPFQTIAR